MGLRDLFLNLNQIGSFADDIRQQAQQRREAEGLQQLREQIPQAVKSGQFENIAAQSLAAGPGGMALSREILGDLIKNQRGSKAAGQPSLSLEQLKGLGVGADESQLQSLVGLPAQQQFSGIGAMQKAISESRQATETARRGRQEVQSQRVGVGAKLDPIFKEVTETDNQFEKVQGALKQNSRPSDAVVFNFLARNVAGERGPLSNDDISRFASRAFGGDIQSVENFFSGATTSVLTADQRKAFDDLVKLAVNKYEGYKSRRLGEALSRAIADNPLLVKEGDELAPTLKKRVEQAGFEYKDGELRKVIKKTSEVGKSINDGGKPMSVDDIKSATAKAFVTDYLAKNPGLSPEQRAKIITNAMKEQ